MGTNDAHLLVDHVPGLGTVFAVSVRTYGLARRQPEGLRVALGVLVLCGVGSFAATETGERAEEAVEVTNTASIALALLALGVLVWRRRQPDVPTAPAVVLLVGTLAVGGLMARAAGLGGEMRHPEVRSGSAPTGAGEPHDSDDAHDD